MFMQSLKPWRVLWESDGGGAAPAEAEDRVAIEQGLENLLRKHGGDAAKVAGLLYQENYQLRADKRGLKSELDELQTRLPDGAIVLTAEQAQTYNALLEHGTPDVIAARLKEHGALRREQMLRDAAAALGWDVDALKVVGANLDYEVREVADGQGGKTTVAFVQVAGEEPVALDDYAATHWSALLPSLRKEPVVSGTPWPKQPGIGNPPHVKPSVDDVIASKLATVEYAI